MTRTVIDTDLPTPKRSKWGLAKVLEPEVQRLVVSSFSGLAAGRALLLHADGKGGAWIDALQAIVPVTAANADAVPALALAFTSLGLEQLGLQDDLVEQFALPFVEGMMQADRRKRLGDVGKAVRSPLLWGPRPDRVDERRGVDAKSSGTESTGLPIHAIALLYDKDHKSLETTVGRITTALQGAGVTIVHGKVLDMMGDAAAKSREHFGFVDGISQPIPYGDGTRDGEKAPKQPDPLHGVPLGDILLGYCDSHANKTSGPFLAGKTVGGAFVPNPPGAAADDLLADPAAQARHDLALNGTYLVVRELDQDVQGFRDSMAAAAKALHQTGDWLAERVVGRTKDGDLLRPDGVLKPTAEGPDNDFLFFQEDREGLGCPMGSHIRRANPRDGLSPKASFCEGLLQSANAHRLLRRGRKYGGTIAQPKQTATPTSDAPKGDEGLLFVCINTDIARQFEFVQQNWMLNPNFATLNDEVDPLVGPKSKMTLPDRPLRRRVDVETFVTLAGGDYFFLPSLPTLRILAKLPVPTA